MDEVESTKEAEEVQSEGIRGRTHGGKCMDGGSERSSVLNATEWPPREGLEGSTGFRSWR